MPQIAVVEELKALLSDQPENPLRPNQVREANDELARLGALASGRDMDGQPQPWVPGDRAAAGRRARQIRESLVAQAPKKITGDRASAVHQKVKEVLESVIQPGLLPRSVMRRNPPGTVGHILRTEFSKPFKDAILTVKRALWGLDPDNADPDYSSMERFRREGLLEGTSSFMADAQIPGVLAMTPLAKSRWPLGEPTAETALGQAQRREATERGRGRSRRNGNGRVKPKRGATPAQLAALERGRAARAAKRVGVASAAEPIAATG